MKWKCKVKLKPGKPNSSTPKIRSRQKIRTSNWVLKVFDRIPYFNQHNVSAP